MVEFQFASADGVALSGIPQSPIDASRNLSRMETSFRKAGYQVDSAYADGQITVRLRGIVRLTVSTVPV